MASFRAAVLQHWISICFIGLVGDVETVRTTLHVPGIAFVLLALIGFAGAQFRAFHDVRVQSVAKDVTISELGERVAQLERPPFPRSSIEIKPFGYVDLTPKEDLIYDERVFLFEVQATNRDDARRLNLSFEVEPVRTPRPELRPVRSHFSRCHTVAKRRYEDSVLPEIVEVSPGSTVKGFLKMSDSTVRPFIVCDDDRGGFGPKGDDVHLEATIHDHVSGQSATLVVPGTLES